MKIDAFSEVTTEVEVEDCNENDLNTSIQYSQCSVDISKDESDTEYGEDIDENYLITDNRH